MAITARHHKRYGEGEIVIPRDRNGEFEPKVLEKRQTRTGKIEQKYGDVCKGMSQRDVGIICARFTRKSHGR